MVERRPRRGRDDHRRLVRRARTARHPGPAHADTGPTGRRTCTDAARTTRTTGTARRTHAGRRTCTDADRTTRTATTDADPGPSPERDPPAPGSGATAAPRGTEAGVPAPRGAGHATLRPRARRPRARRGQEARRAP